MKQRIIAVVAGGFTLVGAGLLGSTVISSHSSHPDLYLSEEIAPTTSGGSLYACGAGKCGAGKCGGGTATTTEKKTKKAIQGVKIQCSVSGMMCGGCERNVTSQLLKLDGVDVIRASHKENMVLLVADTTRVSLDKIRETIHTAGYKAQECKILTQAEAK